LALAARVELAKAHCALVFEDRGGRLTDADVLAISGSWSQDDGADRDLVAGHLFAWLG
jgi:hypothetical protein